MAKKKKKTPAQLLEDLDSSDYNVRWRAADHPNATPEVLLKAMEDEYVDVRWRAADHPNATPEVLLKAMEDEYVNVRLPAARHPNATTEVLLKAIEDEDIRWAAEENPNIKKLDISVERWLELIAGGAFAVNTRNIPARVKRDPRYKGVMLLSGLAPTDS